MRVLSMKVSKEPEETISCEYKSFTVYYISIGVHMINNTTFALILYSMLKQLRSF